MSEAREAKERLNGNLEKMIAMANDFPSMRQDVEAYIAIVSNMTQLYTRIFVDKAKVQLYPHLGG